MSKTAFSNIVRSALLSSYNNICFYCNRPLEWDALHIDHIIPESLSEKMQEFTKIKADYGLSNDFDINGFENLVPVHIKCNLRKSDELFPKPAALYYLTLTRRKIKAIKEEIDKINKRKNKGQIISTLQSALSTDLIKLPELKAILAKAERDNWDISTIELPRGDEFIDEIYKAFYLNEDYGILYDKKVRFGIPEGYIELVDGANKRLKVSTLREWQSAIQNGYSPKTNIDLKSSSAFTFLEELLAALKKAKMPKASFISDHWIDIDQLDYLSPNILHDFEDELNTFARQGKSIGDLVREGLVKVNDSNYYKISIEYNGLETSLIEQFRADFNNDGIEDLFLRGWTRAIGGTFGFGFTTYISKLSQTSLIEEMK